MLDSSLDRSEKSPELDLILVILRSSRKRPIFNPRAKRLHTPGESTLSPAETTPGDTGQNDLPPLQSTQLKLTTAVLP